MRWMAVSLMRTGALGGPRPKRVAAFKQINLVVIANDFDFSWRQTSCCSNEDLLFLRNFTTPLPLVRPGRFFFYSKCPQFRHCWKVSPPILFLDFFLVTVNKPYPRQLVTPKNDGFSACYPAQLNLKSALRDLYVSGAAFVEFIRTNQNWRHL